MDKSRKLDALSEENNWCSIWGRQHGNGLTITGCKWQFIAGWWIIKLCNRLAVVKAVISKVHRCQWSLFALAWLHPFNTKQKSALHLVWLPKQCRDSSVCSFLVARLLFLSDDLLLLMIAQRMEPTSLFLICSVSLPVSLHWGFSFANFLKMIKSILLHG